MAHRSDSSRLRCIVAHLCCLPLATYSCNYFLMISLWPVVVMSKLRISIVKMIFLMSRFQLHTSHSIPLTANSSQHPPLMIAVEFQDLHNRHNYINQTHSTSLCRLKRFKLIISETTYHHDPVCHHHLKIYVTPHFHQCSSQFMTAS